MDNPIVMLVRDETLAPAVRLARAYIAWRDACVDEDATGDEDPVRAADEELDAAEAAYRDAVKDPA